MAATSSAAKPGGSFLERRLSLRQQLAAGLLLGVLATSAFWVGLTWLDARTPDPPGPDLSYLLLGLAGAALGTVVGWAVLGRIEWRVADLAVYATALANNLPAMPRPTVGTGALADLTAGLNGAAARLVAQEERLRDLSEHSARLTAPLREAAAQEERNRLARDLHDTIKQQLFSIGVTAAAAEARWDDAPASARAAIGEIRALAGEAQVEMRALLTQLRPTPVATIGLIAALREQLDALAYRAEVEVEADLRPLPDGLVLVPGAEDALFRIAQEGLANIARHARARKVRVTLGLVPGSVPDPRVAFVISDDGQGFDADSAGDGPGMGLRNMRARAAEIGGTLEITSHPLGGTTLVVLVPLYQIPTLDITPEEPDMDRYLPDLRRHAFVRGASSVASVIYAWILLLALQVDLSGPLDRVALPFFFFALGVSIVAEIWADQLARRFRAKVGDAPEWTLRLTRTNALAGTVDFALAIIIVPFVCELIFRNTGLGRFLPDLRLHVLISCGVFCGVATAWAFWRLVRTERALTAITARWTTRARLEQEQSALATNLATNLVLLAVFSSFLRTRIPTAPATVEQWVQSTATYPLIIFAVIAAWSLLWCRRRLQRFSRELPTGSSSGARA